MGTLKKMFNCGTLLCGLSCMVFSAAVLGANNHTPYSEVLEITADNPPSLWTTAEGLTSDGHALLEQIRISENEGLNPARYHYSKLSDITSQPWQPSLREPLDQLMTSAFEQLIQDLGQGVLKPRDVQRRWFQNVQEVDIELAYLSLQIPGNTIDSVVEQHRPLTSAYHKLVRALVRYREIEQAGGWPTVALGPTMRVGMKDSRIAAIEKRLNITGDMPSVTLSPAGETPLTFSTALHKAVKKFQSRHGLPVDGIIGNKTLEQMNIPVAKKIETIELNLERVRWLPRDLGERHIMTNIAEYKLRVMEHDNVVMSMPVVVGKKKHQTPVFSDEIEFLVVNPTWTVPLSIATKELLPDERRSPGYLARNNFELIGWENGRTVIRSPNSIDREEYSADRFRYTIRQKPGKRNALGKVKFMFPNRYSIYLHDTPANSLFKRNTRAFSHGCVRVGSPKSLAETLLGFDGWSKRKFESAYNQQKQTVINLSQPVKNHITYRTSWVDEDYQLNFRPDIYGHDNNLAKALDKPNAIELPPTILAEFEE